MTTSAPPPWLSLPSSFAASPAIDLVFWSCVPRHCVTAITATDDWLFSGDSDGNVVQWKFNSDAKKLKPRLLFHRRGTPRVTALATAALSQSVSSEVLLVGSADGCVSCWSMEGECLSSTFATPYHATTMLVFHCHHYHCIALSSPYHPYVYVLSLPSLAPVMILGDEADPTGILSLALINKKAKRDDSIEQRAMIVSVSRGGKCNVWDVSNKLRKHSEKNNVIVPFFSFSTFQSSSLSLSPSPTLLLSFCHGANSPLIYLLTDSTIELVSTASLQQLQSFPLSKPSSAAFVSVQSLSSSPAHPQSQHQYEERLLVTLTSRQSMVVIVQYHYTKKRGVQPHSIDEHCQADIAIDSVTGLDSDGSVATSVSVDAARQFVMVGSDSGDVMVMQPAPSLSQSPSLSLPIAVRSSLARGFTDNAGESLLPPTLSSSLSQSHSVSCSLTLITSTLPYYYLATGHSNGTLTVQSLHTQTKTNAVTAVIHTAAITCMAQHYDTVSDQWYLLSGSEDGSVVVFDTESRRIRSRLYVSSPVRQLVQPSPPLLLSQSQSLSAFPTDSSAKPSHIFRSLLFVLCANNSVKVFSLLDYTLRLSLYGHTSPPVSVHCTSRMVEWDEIGVQCADGSLYLWSMTGQLVNVVASHSHTDTHSHSDSNFRASIFVAAERGWLNNDSQSQLNSLSLQAVIELLSANTHTSSNKQQSSPTINGRKSRKKVRESANRHASPSPSQSQSVLAPLGFSPFILSALSALSAKPPLPLPSLLSFTEIDESVRASQLEFVTLLSVLFPTNSAASPDTAALAVSRCLAARVNPDSETARARYRFLMGSIKEDARHFTITNTDDDNDSDSGEGSASAPLTEFWRLSSHSNSHLARFAAVLSVDLDSFCRQLQQRYVQHADQNDDVDDDDDNVIDDGDSESIDGAGNGTETNTAKNDSDLRTLLSLTFDWDGTGSTETIMKSRLSLPAPLPNRGYALSSHDRCAVSLSFPNYSVGHRRWLLGSLWSSHHALTITAVCQSIVSATTSIKQSMLYQSLLLYYHQALPDSHPNYQPPSIPALVLASFSDSDSVLCAARVLLQQSLDSYSPTQLTSLSLQWGAYYDFPIPIEPVFSHDRAKLDDTDSDIQTEKPETLAFVASTSLSGNSDGDSDSISGANSVSVSELQVCMVLTLIGLIDMNQRKRARRAAMLQLMTTKPRSNSNSRSHQSVSPLPSLSQSQSTTPTLTEFEAKSQYLTFTLLRTIAAPVPPSNVHAAMLTSLACDLLYKSMNYLRVHITQPIPLMRRLLALSLSMDQSLAQSAHRALIECGRVAPALFIECVNKESLNVRNDSDVRQSAIAILVALVKAHPQSLAKVLPMAVSACIKCLDPSQPTQRKLLLHSATSALYTLVQSFPSCSFHQLSQRFAVGTGISQHCVIIIYDLRTATVWRLLEGHGSEVSAVIFSNSSDGHRLVSYSALESPAPSVRVWNTESSGGFLSGLIGMSGKCIRTVRLDRIDHSTMTHAMRKVETARLMKIAVHENDREQRRERTARLGIADSHDQSHGNGSGGYDSPVYTPSVSYSSTSLTALTSFDSPLTVPRSTLTDKRSVTVNGHTTSGNVTVSTPTSGIRPSSVAIPINQSVQRLPPPMLNGRQSSLSSSQSHSLSHQSLSVSPTPSLSLSLPQSQSPQLPFTPDLNNSPQLYSRRTNTPPLLMLDDTDSDSHTNTSLTGSPSLTSAVSDGSVTSQVRVSLLSRMLAIQFQWLNDNEVRLIREDGSSVAVAIQ